MFKAILFVIAPKRKPPKRMYINTRMYKYIVTTSYNRI